MYTALARVLAVATVVGTLSVPFVTLAAASVTIDTINGQPPAGHCIAGTMTIVVHGTRGTNGGPYSVEVGNGTSTSSPVSAGSGANGNFSNVSITYTPSGAGANLYVVVFHGSDTGADSSFTGITQCIAPPTKGVLTLKKHVATGAALASAFNMHVKLGASDVTGSPQTGLEAGTDYQLLPNTYAVSEDVNPNYTGVTSCHNDTDNLAIVGSSVALLAGKNYTCTVTNTFSAPTTGTLHVVKHVVTDNGGSAVAGNFSMHVKNGVNEVSGSPQAGVEAGTDYTLAGGSYTVSETGGPSGYTATFSGDCNGSGAVTVVNGATKTCTITNNDNAATLTVTKVVINNRFSFSISDFPLSVGITQVVSGVAHLFNAGSYTVSESGVAAVGYNAVITGDCASNGSITLGLGETKTCTITNTEKTPGTLHVIKHVINDEPSGFEGTSVAADFTLNVTGGHPSPASFAGDEAGTAVILDAGASYSVSEGAAAGYGVNYSADCASTMPEGGDKTCTVTNNDNPSTTGGLTVVKVLPNDNGGTAVVTDWTYSVTDGVTPVSVTAGANNQFAGGSYTVSETGGPDGYTATFSGDCDANGNVTVVNGASKTCTITNDDQPASIVIVKNAAKADGTFTFAVTGQNPSDITTVGGQGTSTLAVDAGTYDVTETVPSGWTLNSVSCIYNNQSIGNAIQNGETVTLDPGDTVTCTFTNTRHTGSLTVTKVVVGGDASSDDFNMHVMQNSADIAGSPQVGDENGTTYNNLLTGTYVVSETDGPSHYVATFSGDCDASGDVDVTNDGSSDCTVTNTFVPFLQCSDTLDNDGDGKVDSADPGCHDDNNPNNASSYHPEWNNESNVDAGSAPAGGGGGGGGGPLNQGGGQVLGASTGPVGQVLGVSCGLFMNQHLRKGSVKNNPGQVMKLQDFLTKNGFGTFTSTGTFGPLTEGAVKAFQAKYGNDILVPWGINTPTGLVYLTTLYKINKLECPELADQLPPLVPWSANPNAQ